MFINHKMIKQVCPVLSFLPSHRGFVGEVVEGRAGGGLKLLFAHFVLVLEALFGGHRSEKGLLCNVFNCGFE